MPVQKITREVLVAQSLTVFQRMGYHAAGMSDIAAACGLTKATLYHYYPSKEALVEAVIQEVTVYFRARVFSYAWQEEIPAKERLANMLSKHFYIAEKYESCFIGNMTLETATQVPAFRELFNAFFDEWVAALTHLYETRYPPEEARHLAESCVMESEGALMLLRLRNDSAYLARCQAKYIALL
jgi:TetR/AcrR family transcriptional repressor of nem operon